jgi:hypothetical protein
MSVSCQADPHTSAYTTNDPALMAICRVGAGHPVSVPQGCQRIPVSVCHHQQVHQKWPQATPLVRINNQSTIKFIKSIICRFRVLNRIIINNGFQFTSSAFQGSKSAMRLLLI